MFGTRRAAGGHRSFWVPIQQPQYKRPEFGDEGSIGRVMGTYKLDGDLLVVEEIDTLKYDTERTLSDLFANSVMHPHNV